MNMTLIMGRLTKEPELKQTGSGIAYCNFSVAVDRPYKQGEEKKTDFFNCTAWRGQAELIAKYFGKGSRILLRGAMQSRQYEKDGVKLTAWDLIVDQVTFVDTKNDSQQQGTTPPTPPALPTAQPATTSKGLPLAKEQPQQPQQVAAPEIPEVDISDIDDESNLPFNLI